MNREMEDLCIEYKRFKKCCSNLNLHILFAIMDIPRFANYKLRHFNMWNISQAVDNPINQNATLFYFADYDHGLCYYAVSKSELDGPVFVDTGSLISRCSDSFIQFVENLVYNPEELLIFSE